MLTMKFLLLLTLVLATCWASNPILDDVPPQVIEEVLDDYRLPNNVIPSRYVIELQTNFVSKENNFTYVGLSTITLNISKTNSITFHAKGLEFFEEETFLEYKIKEKKNNETKLKDVKDKPIDSYKDIQKDFVTITFKEDLKNLNIEDANLTLKYKGKLSEELRGFFKTSYNKRNKKWLAATHFEPVSARQAFPCWDEPQFKAEFSIVILTEKFENNDFKAISNMPIDKKLSKERNFIFKKTPKMSPYLVAFVVYTDFEALQKEEDETFRVWANPTVTNDTKKYAFDYGLKVLEGMKNFTDISYNEKMDKMDQIAIPNFNGAMENWGLVTYSESELLYTENKTTESKQATATVIAHEFAHQWFGNLVTCKWWNHLWLNEGFATFFQYYISDKVVPNVEKDKKSWRLMEQFVIKNVQKSSFVVDASSKTHALVPKISVQTPTQIRNLFDDISYKKGASILHMMYGFLSEDIFQKGIRKYLTDNEYQAVESVNFFKAIEQLEDDKKEKIVKKYLPKDVKLNLTKVMENWINEPGYPVVTVTWNETSPKVIDIKQTRFFLVKPSKVNKIEWYVPINYVTQNSPDEVMPKNKIDGWLIPEITTKSFNITNNTQWILFNINQTGYYRVNYDKSNWERLAKYLENAKDLKNITAINRAQLIDDALNLARAGYLAYDTALQITTYLSKETDYIPWYAAARAFNYLDDVLLDGKNYTAYHKYVANNVLNFINDTLLHPYAINSDKPPNGTHVEKLSRVLALNTACKYGLKQCEDFVTKRLTEWLEKKDNNLVPDLRKGIICAGLRNAESKTWNETLQRYKDSKDKDERADILAGLGCASKPKIPENFLALTLEKDSAVEIFAVMNSICAGNPRSFDLLLNFINENIENIQKADKEDNSSLIALLNELSNRIINKEQYAKYSLFVYGKLQLAEKVQGLAVAIQNIHWIDTHRDRVEAWISKNCKVCQSSLPDSASAVTLTSFVLLISLLLTRFFD